MGFEEIEDGRRWIVRLDARVVPVLARFKRAHQGWRYLAAEDAPGDFGDGEGDLADMPVAMRDELQQAESRGLIERNRDIIKPTRQGRRFLNELLQIFLPEKSA